MFKKFLLSEGAANELDFWYACKGLKQYSPKEQNLIERLVQIIYQNYVRSQGECCVCCLQSETRIECHGRFVNKDISQNMFDKAQQEVEAFLRIKHAAFVESELYISYLQSVQAGGWDSPKCYSNESNSNSSSNSGDAQRPSSTLLPTVQEEPDVEPDQERSVCGNEGTLFDSGNHRMSDDAAPPKTKDSTKDKIATKEPSSVAAATVAVTSSASDVSSSAVTAKSVGKKSSSASSSTAATSVAPQSLPGRLTAGALVATLEQRMAYTAKRSNRCRRQYGLIHRFRSGVPPNPYHTQYVPYLPTSAQDSELQSMSSDAATENSM
ncbi:unnamed protein product [Soboliphyme baturini]|uniref:RGS domain-containing protein n=1 Tax=Soboliphyme baturini TaxID=241478 RepID=A0A3P8DV49_9BILA|nr:unnamed protein product [Soboliphyme baturini]